MTTGLTIISSSRMEGSLPKWERLSKRPLVGKDILELLSSSMYVNPLAIFREYIQNSADAIDEARKDDLLGRAAGRVDITIDVAGRTVRIRDNGTGLSRNSFAQRLVAFGGSSKRGSQARGFRGVGRLAGLGYAQELVFRSRTSGDEPVSELRWDCRELKSLLRRQDGGNSLEDIVAETVSTRSLTNGSFPKRFFEVELVTIVRHGNDILLNKAAVESYLAQVAPIPFAPGFRFGPEIEALIRPEVNLGNIDIHINGSERPIYRPHGNEFDVRKKVVDRFSKLEALTIPGSDGNVAALGWILHHSYFGSIPLDAGIHGLRLRSGNMQVGEADVLEEFFPEPRFNSWMVGEIHILDPRVLPNGRRDHFEHSVHFRSILNFVSNKTKEIARLCRVSSLRRNRIRHFEQVTNLVHADLAVLKQGAITRTKRLKVKNAVVERIDVLQRIVDSPALDSDLRESFRKRFASLKTKSAEIMAAETHHRKLARFRNPKRLLIQKLCDLIYQNSDKHASARKLVDKILRGL